MYKKFLIILALIIKFVDSEMKGYIFGGEYTNVNEYPHSVLLQINSKGNSVLCGGSILNQDIVMSAAHCLDDYKSKTKDRVVINYGASSLASMSLTIMKYCQIHGDFNSFTLYADISLVRCKTPITFSKLAKRVAIMMSPPKDNIAFVSGWGAINNHYDLPTGIKHTKQQLQKMAVCRKHLSLPAGSFCAGPITGEGHPNVGDSGSALIVKKYVQIGIVSFKVEDRSLVVYTNVSYYYTWIKNNAANMYCFK